MATLTSPEIKATGLSHAEPQHGSAGSTPVIDKRSSPDAVRQKPLDCRHPPDSDNENPLACTMHQCCTLRRVDLASRTSLQDSTLQPVHSNRRICDATIRLRYRGVSFGQASSTPWATRLGLEGRQLPRRISYGPGRLLVRLAERHERPGRLADGPFHGMEAVAAVGDVRRPRFLQAGKQILDPARNQGAERDLERQRADVDVVDPAGGRMQVDPVASPRRRCRGRARRPRRPCPAASGGRRCRRAARPR